MKRLLFLLFVTWLFLGCRKVGRVEALHPAQEVKDTLYKIRCLDILPPVEILEKWKKYPDSIVIAFTRDGIAEDSVIAYRNGGLLDSLDNYYSPAYIFKAAVGDVWIYDSNGKFVYFYCTPLPHSGQGHSYNP